MSIANDFDMSSVPFSHLGTINYLCRGVGWKNPSVNITNSYDPSQERKQKKKKNGMAPVNVLLKLDSPPPSSPSSEKNRGKNQASTFNL